jgi:nucleoside-diphosphate-sugar epimerase
MESVLIIGGTGLISTSITRALLGRGIKVTHYNRGKTPSRVGVEVPTVNGDRRDFPEFERRMHELPPFDCVIDMVCFKPDEAESAVRAFASRVGQLVFCSTVDVYAKSSSRYPIVEDEPYGGLGSYALGKVACEKILREADVRGDLPLTVIRPAWTYGEGGSVLHSLGWHTAFLDRLRRGMPVIVHGDGTSLWAACHVDDAGEAFAAAVGAEKCFHRCYHVTGEEWLSWRQLYALAALALGTPDHDVIAVPSEFLALAAPGRGTICTENLQFCNVFDNTAARRDLGFRYTVSVAEGFRRTIRWLEENGRIEPAESDPQYDEIIAKWRRAARAT